MRQEKKINYLWKRGRDNNNDDDDEDDDDEDDDDDDDDDGTKSRPHLESFLPSTT